MDDRLHICLLGTFSISKGEQPVRSLNAERPQTLLAYLLLHRQTPVSRQRLAYTLWPDSAEEQARTNLRNLLHTLRRSLPEADSYLQLDTHTVQWRPEADYTLDVADFQAAWHAGRLAGDAVSRRLALETAVSLYTGPLLPGNYEDWLISIREDLQQTYQDALRQLAQLLADMDDMQTAVHYARLLQREDPLAETAVILLMQLYARLGDQTAVHRTYQNCTNALREELDAEPVLETQAAYAAALQQAAGSTAPGAAVSPASGRSSPRQAPHLPPQPTPFVGREVELAKLAEYLADPHCRLLTIVGPGGTGKTRLALQAAYGHVTVFADGAAFVSLASVTDPLMIPSAIAQGLRFSFTSAASRKIQILQYLADKTLLLVLDNVEQLGEKVTFMAEILAAAPQVKLLVTSRQRLNLQEEWVFPLQGLPLPDTHDLQSISENSAAALFIQSARRHDPHFRPDTADWQAVGRICHLVAGMPLGLELAAPWIRLLSCAEIAREIAANLDFLTSTQHNIPDRHRSMRAVFNQSWEMLTPEEQAVFSSLSLFVGGFSREGAEQVAGADLPILSTLWDKSLVRRLANGRYDIHELLRQYAASQLAAMQHHAAAQARFTAYYASLAETAAAYLVGSEQQPWLDRLEIEYDNLRAALNRTVHTQDVETAVRLGAALGRFWWLRYRTLEGGNWLRQILALPGPQTETRSRAVSYAGMLARLRRDYAEAEAWLTQSIRYQRQTGSKQDLGRSVNELGMLYLDQGQFEQAHPLFVEWLALARELEFPHGMTIALLNLGMVAHQLDSFDQAEIYFQEGLTLSRQFGIKTNIAMLLTSYSMLLLDQNRFESAGEMLRESVQINLELGHQDGLSWAFLGLLTLHQKAGNLEMAAFLVGVQEALRQSMGAPFPPTNQFHFEGIIHDLQQQLGGELFTTHQLRGQTAPLSEAIALTVMGDA
ncbi:MAG: tetratricopeptide repeat protein [Chloroflexota bacterium]